jgi:hypothetical protein
VLSSSVSHGSVGGHPVRIPIDFIGGLDSLSSDFALMLLLAERRTGKKLDKDKRKKIIHFLSERSGNKRKEGPLAKSISQLRDPEMDQLVRDAYAQDMACFGQPINATREKAAP